MSVVSRESDRLSFAYGHFRYNLLARGRLDEPVCLLDGTLPPVGVTPPVDTRARYYATHIPGAVFFDIEELSDRPNPLPHLLPPPDVFACNMSALGIGDQMDIVIYQQEGVFSGPRAWWTLKIFGAQNVYLLDGGLRAWIEAGLPSDSGPVARPRRLHASARPKRREGFFAGTADDWAHGQILDARSAGRFADTLPDPSRANYGHMPGAASIAYTELVDDGHLKSVEELRRVRAKKEWIWNGQSPPRAARASLQLYLHSVSKRQAQSKSASMDGSWAEYGGNPQAVIEKSAS